MKISEHLRESARVKEELCQQESLVAEIITEAVQRIRNGGKVFACGNGGSACDSMHLVEELLARYSMERPGIAAQNLLDPGTITCWANDYEYSTVFSRQVETLCSDKDILIVFSTSGNSPSIVNALKAAKAKQCYAIGLLGKGGGEAKALCDQAVVIDSGATSRIQEAHITLVHILVENIEQQLFS